jgi:amino acid adenylation domain-containing protein
LNGGLSGQVRLEGLVAAQAGLRPGALAVSGPDGQLTYGQLDRLAGQIARRLAALGVGDGGRVALWLEKSAYGVAATQAALRLGAAYVPLDPQAPAARAQALLADCAPAALVTDADRRARLAALPAPSSLPPILAGPGLAAGDELPGPYPAGPSGGDPDAPAYILYTSGSTGRPKGVLVSHRGALAFVGWAAELLGLTAADRLANHAPLQFDLSVFDLYAAFLVGASVHIVPEGTPGGGLTRFLLRQQISVWYSVPSALALMMDSGRLLESTPAALRTVVFAGEVFPVGRLRRLREHLPGVRLLNFYGPTETNVCAWHEVGAIPPDRTRPVPIGTAACGNRIWAERPDGGHARPGEEGELVVQGPTVMLGYWGAAAQLGRPYRTGDIVRVLPGPAFEFIGRRDDLVKVRGHRVELGEIEAVLLSHPQIADAAVVVTGDGPAARLCACVVARVPGAGQQLGPLPVKRFLAERLPRYMIVDSVRQADRIPRTATGKADRQGLADWFARPRPPDREAN